MGRLRSKILFGLIAYFGGFATALYYVAPVSQDAADRKGGAISWRWPGQDGADSRKSQDMAEHFKQNMNKAIAFAEENAAKIGAMIKSQCGSEQKDSGSKTATE